MARCGCANGTTCNCVVKAGANVTVIGNGSSSSPYVVSAATATVAPLDTPTVDMHVTGGPAYIVSADVIISPDSGNTLVAHGNGLFVPDVDTVFTNGPGIAPIVGGVVMACLSTDVGNSLVFGSDNCLFVAPGAVSCAAVAACFTTLDTTTVNLSPSGTLPLTADVIIDPSPTNLISTTTTNGLLADLITGCGLSGEGNLASPLIVDTNAAVWPFACPETNGTKIFCDTATGGLHGPPEKFCVDEYAKRIVAAGTQDVSTLVPGPYPKPATNFGPTFTLTVTNPSPCLPLKLTLVSGFAHFNTRYNNAGRGNVLFAINITAITGAALVTAGDQFHEQWLRDQNAAEADNTYDTQGGIVQGVYTVAAGAVATFTAQAALQITNYSAGMVITVFDWELFLHAQGCN